MKRSRRYIDTPVRFPMHTGTQHYPRPGRNEGTLSIFCYLLPTLSQIVLIYTCYLKSRSYRLHICSESKPKRRNIIMAFWDNPNMQRAEKATVGTLSGFKTFILRGNVVDLAIGIMIGAAFSGVVNSLVGYVITPLIP